MSKITLILCVLCIASALYGDGIRNTTYHTAKQISYPQAAAADDTAMYNPAGTVFLDNGIYAGLHNMCSLDRIQVTAADGQKYTGEGEAWIIPSLSLLYKQDRYALFLYGNIYGGGGAEFRQGSPIVEDLLMLKTSLMPALRKFEPSANSATSLSIISYYYGIMMGGAYKICDCLAVAIGGMYVGAENRFDADAAIMSVSTMDAHFTYTENAHGYTAMAAVTLNPVRNLTVALTYTGKTRLIYRKSVSDARVSATGTVLGILAAVGQSPDSIAGRMRSEDGQAYQHDVPAIATLGINYRLHSIVELGLQANYMFNRYSVWQPGTNTINEAPAYNDSIEYGIGVQLTLTPTSTLRLGMAYADKGANPNHYGAKESPHLDEFSVGIGFGYAVAAGIILDIAYGKPWDRGHTTADGSRLNKNRNAFGISITGRL